MRKPEVLKSPKIRPQLGYNLLGANTGHRKQWIFFLTEDGLQRHKRGDSHNIKTDRLTSRLFLLSHQLLYWHNNTEEGQKKLTMFDACYVTLNQNSSWKTLFKTGLTHGKNVKGGTIYFFFFNYTPGHTVPWCGSFSKLKNGSPILISLIHWVLWDIKFKNHIFINVPMDSFIRQNFLLHFADHYIQFFDDMTNITS